MGGCFPRRPKILALKTMRNKLFFLLALTLSVGSCGDSNEHPVPNVIVREDVFLTNLEAQGLRRNGGHMLVDAGVRGIVVYRVSENNYRAFERNCTYQPKDSCAQVEVADNEFFMIDSCCSSRFNWQGEVIDGPAPLPLKQYRTELEGNRLKIRN